MRPFRLDVVPQCIESLETLEGYVKTCEGFERIGKHKPNGKRLAIVGGGPSLANHLEELKAWDGDIWAINSTGAFLAKHGIESVFFTVDPGNPDLINTGGMTRALLATSCHPTLRDRFQSVQYFDLSEFADTGVVGSSTSVTRATSLALTMGYCDVHIFGCEGARNADKNHIDHHCEVQEESDPPLIIRAGGKDYITYLEFIGQAEYLADLIQFAPDVFKDRSGGLIEVMTEYRDTWEVVAVSARLKEKLETVNGKVGMYERPYQPIS